LDLEVMKTVVDSFVGEHDFTSFCRSVEGKSNVRVVEEATWVEEEGLYEFWVKSNSFCHQMVRSLVGYAYDVGRGFLDAGMTSDVIEARDRSLIKTVAPSHGLNLWEVGY
jgi:tRNA pseudouridine38-40 synthase